LWPAISDTAALPVSNHTGWYPARCGPISGQLPGLLALYNMAAEAAARGGSADCVGLRQSIGTALAKDDRRGLILFLSSMSHRNASHAARLQQCAQKALR